MNIHYGKPIYEGGFRFRVGTIKAKDRPEREWAFEHPIKWWCGISFARMFIGIVRTDKTRDIIK
jgi:hypothetical protein